MLNIQRFICNMLQENCYVVNDETKECVIIDCGAFYPEEKNALLQYIRAHELKPVHLIATHGHLDHNFGNRLIFDHFGLKLEIHHEDENLIKHHDRQAEIFYQLVSYDEIPPIGRLFTGDDAIVFGNHSFTIIETPGHSKGSVFFYCAEERVCFSGDTLFHNSVGRTDFEGGSMFMLIQSLRTISQLPDETIVYPGHGQQTTIGIEVAGNPYIDR